VISKKINELFFFELENKINIKFTFTCPKYLGLAFTKMPFTKKLTPSKKKIGIYQKKNQSCQLLYHKKGKFIFDQNAIRASMKPEKRLLKLAISSKKHNRKKKLPVKFHF